LGIAWVERQIKLGVICIEVIMFFMTFNDLFEWARVDTKK